MTVFLARAFGATLLVATLAGGDRAALAQVSGSGAAVEFSSNAATVPGFTTPRLGRRAAMGQQLAAVPVTTPNSARATPPDAEFGGNEGDAPSHAFEHFFLAGIAALVRGDPASAATIFAVTSIVAGEMPQMTYLLALSRVLSDFDHRDHVLMAIARARAADPDHPLYQIIEVLADARLSALKADGALYLTPDGARQLRTAFGKLTSSKDAYNSKYVPVALALEATGDPSLPQRVSRFVALLGPGRSIALPNIAAGQALGRLLVLAIPTERLARYEARFLTGVGGTREAMSTAPDQQRRSDLAGRSLALTTP